MICLLMKQIFVKLISAAAEKMQHAEYVRRPISFSGLIGPGIDPSECKNITELEIASKTGQQKNSNGIVKIVDHLQC